LCDAKQGVLERAREREEAPLLGERAEQEEKEELKKSVIKRKRTAFKLHFLWSVLLYSLTLASFSIAR
jgi:hypothetical protein